VEIENGHYFVSLYSRTDPHILEVSREDVFAVSAA